ncbi:MAG TPA: hypothetical protein VKC53_01650 [Patescibacteria group bacterium]|nr:hypothetical protein [Patescibacteria group bacterium]
MGSWIKKNRLNILIFILLLAGFFIRTYFIDKVVVGDLMNYSEWGERLATTGPKNFYFSEGWYYSVPVYPPVSMWMFAGLNILNQHRYVLAQVHNLIRLPPSSFIIYFYKWGNILLIKLPSILCDLGLSLIVYKLIFKLTKNVKKSLAGLCFFLFNPITIFISGAWGQTDSIVGILGLLSFLTLLDGNLILSMPILFLSIYFKPSWAILGPFYLFTMYKIKPKFRQILFGSLITLLLFIVTTAPFASGNVFTYGLKLYKDRYPIPIGFDGKASISAFNFQTIFWRMDIDFSSQKLLGVTSGHWGMFFFIILNFVAMLSFSKAKNKLLSMLSGIFMIAMGSFLFMPTMLERYFFPAFAPMVILAFSKPRLLISLVIINLILIANITYSFYRRGSDELYHFFIDNNYLLMRAVSVIQVLLFVTFTRRLMIQFKRE